MSSMKVAIKLSHRMTIAECFQRAQQLSVAGLLSPKNMFRRPLCGGPGKWVHESATPDRSSRGGMSP